jgi:predicted hotdog family 3-hydroxylacyl-ACP dehydratase
VSLPDRLDRAAIAAMIPHGGSMCLLDAVERWDDRTIRCTTQTHAAAGNPLARGGHVASVNLVEYGAQAMAIHGRLLELKKGSGPPRAGLLVTVRDLALECAWIEDAAALSIEARRLMGSPAGLLYEIEIRGGDRLLARGRVGVIHPPG